MHGLSHTSRGFTAQPAGTGCSSSNIGRTTPTGAPWGPRSMSIWVMERTSALSTSSPLRSFCGSGQGVHSHRRVSGAAQGAGSVQERAVCEQAVWQRVLDCPVSEPHRPSQPSRHSHPAAHAPAPCPAACPAGGCGCGGCAPPRRATGPAPAGARWSCSAAVGRGFTQVGAGHATARRRSTAARDDLAA